MAFFRKFSLKNFGEKKKDMPEGQWQQCPKCKAMLQWAELVIAGNSSIVACMSFNRCVLIAVPICCCPPASPAGDARGGSAPRGV
jgi:hypothetical protein